VNKFQNGQKFQMGARLLLVLEILGQFKNEFAQLGPRLLVWSSLLSLGDSKTCTINLPYVGDHRLEFTNGICTFNPFTYRYDLPPLHWSTNIDCCSYIHLVGDLMYAFIWSKPQINSFQIFVRKPNVTKDKKLENDLNYIVHTHF
jgi:hypothetical protein